METGVSAAKSKELVVGAVFDDAAMAENEDLIGVTDGGESMSDDEAGAAFE